MTQLNIFSVDDDDTAGKDEPEIGLASQADGSRERWGGLPVSEISGSVEEIKARLPRFERRSFITPPSNSVTGTAANAFYDAIVRLPLANTAAEVSVGIVRKSYQLVQHVDLFNLVIDAFHEAKVEIKKIQATLKATPHAERIRLTLLLPDTDKFRFRISDTDHMNLRLELFNSVDASTRCVALLGWFRFVCGNGLVVGVTQTEVRGVHNSRLDVNAIGIVLSKGLTDAIKEKQTFERWLKLRVLVPALDKWVDGPLKKLWGVKAAARVYHIARGGRDVTLTDPFERAVPSQKSVEPGVRVPGSGIPDGGMLTAFGVSQALSWVAGQRPDIFEQMNWKEEIPGLMRRLLAAQAH
jgi:Domain of unknown function (DUF932)